MYESLIATLIFWSTFCFTLGPFWIAIMEVAKHESFKTIYKNYITYQLTGWLSTNIIIGIVVQTVGKFNDQVFTALYFIGGVIILYMAYKALLAKQINGKKFNFNWKSMIILSYSNPKVWLTVPVGFLAANFSNSLWVNISIFYLLSLPIFWTGLFFWGMVGRHGAKVTKNKLSYFNVALLIGFSSYLFYKGFTLI